MYISLILLLISTVSCKQKNNTEIIAEYFKSQNSDKELIAEIDFSKSDSTLLSNIEKQLKVDLCDNSRFTAKMEFEDIELKFPAYANKNCNWNTSLHNIISILINKKNQALVSDKLVEQNNSLENKVILATKEMIIGTERKSLIYLIEWDTQLKSELIKKRIFEILQAIRKYSNELANIKYKKNISDLTEMELIEIKKGFSGIIGFNGNFDPPPPPPPEMKTELESE